MRLDHFYKPIVLFFIYRENYFKLKKSIAGSNPFVRSPERGEFFDPAAQFVSYDNQYHYLQNMNVKFCPIPEFLIFAIQTMGSPFYFNPLFVTPLNPGGLVLEKKNL